MSEFDTAILDVQKLSPGPGDILFIRYGSGRLDAVAGREFQATLHEAGIDVFLVFGTEDTKIEDLDEKEMAEHGWVRAASREDGLTMVWITVNGKDYQFPSSGQPGRILRKMAGIPDDHYLYRERAGRDDYIVDTDFIAVTEGDYFFSVPHFVSRV